jgi:hypothetical protein
MESSFKDLIVTSQKIDHNFNFCVLEIKYFKI